MFTKLNLSNARKDKGFLVKPVVLCGIVCALSLCFAATDGFSLSVGNAYGSNIGQFECT